MGGSGTPRRPQTTRADRVVHRRLRDGMDFELIPFKNIADQAAYAKVWAKEFTRI